METSRTSSNVLEHFQKKTQELCCQPNIYGDDQSGRVPKREFQHIRSIIYQNVMIFLPIMVLI